MVVDNVYYNTREHNRKRIRFFLTVSLLVFKVGRYGKQVIVNLVDQKKDEGRLEQSFKGFHQQVKHNSQSSISTRLYLTIDFNVCL